MLRFVAYLAVSVVVFWLALDLALALFVLAL